MPAKNKPFVVYLDDTAVLQLEQLRDYFSKKQGGVKISDSYIGRALISEKHTEIVDKQNNRERITTIVNRLEKLEQAIRELTAMLERMEGGQ